MWRKTGLCGSTETINASGPRYFFLFSLAFRPERKAALAPLIQKASQKMDSYNADRPGANEEIPHFLVKPGSGRSVICDHRWYSALFP